MKKVLIFTEGSRGICAATAILATEQDYQEAADSVIKNIEQCG